jgi:hypothetical protein
VYRYIARSIAHFVTVDAFSRSLGGAGFDVTSVRSKLLGGVAIHVAIRQGPG